MVILLLNNLQFLFQFLDFELWEVKNIKVIDNFNLNILRTVSRYS